MANPNCPGRRNNIQCGMTLYRCKKCGNVGCAQAQRGKCTNQAFASSKCLRCGSTQKEIFR